MGSATGGEGGKEEEEEGGGGRVPRSRSPGVLAPASTGGKDTSTPFSNNGGGGLGAGGHAPGGTAPVSAGAGGREQGARKISIDYNGGGGRRARSGSLFDGFRVLVLGAGSTSAKAMIESKIAEMGGLILDPSDYERCTHICLMEEGDQTADGKPTAEMAGKKVVTGQWIFRCCAENAISDNHDSANKPVMLVSTSKKPRPPMRFCQETTVKRRLAFEDEINEEQIRRHHHNLFFCPENHSSNTSTLAVYAQTMEGKAHITVFCPGSDDNPAYHTYTALEVKLLVKDLYILLKSLHRAGYSLGGTFSAKNFIVTDGLYRKNICFGQLEKGSLQHSVGGAEKKDMKCFKVMVRKEIFKRVLQPHDLTVWLSLVGGDNEEIMPSHLSVQEDHQACSRFLVLCEAFMDKIESVKNEDSSKKAIFDRILKNLEGYNGWKSIVSAEDGNRYLKGTLKHADLVKNFTPYADDISGLVRLLRNSRHHSARGQQRHFLAIIAHHFPNIVSDLQPEMFREGYMAA